MPIERDRWEGFLLPPSTFEAPGQAGFPFPRDDGSVPG
jgi:hypothetical protein